MFGTFAGVFSPAFVAVSALLWNILGSFFSGFCSCFGEFMEHLPEVYLEFAADDLVTKYHHTNLPCLRQSRRRQTSLALKAPRAFNLSKLTLRVAFARYALSASADRRAQSFQPKRVPALKELEIPMISSSVKAESNCI